MPEVTYISDLGEDDVIGYIQKNINDKKKKES